MSPTIPSYISLLVVAAKSAVVRTEDNLEELKTDQYAISAMHMGKKNAGGVFFH